MDDSAFPPASDADAKRGSDTVFAPAAWAALFPRPPPPPRRFASRPPEDPAAALRVPLPPRALAAESAAAGHRFTAFLVRATFVGGKWQGFIDVQAWRFAVGLAFVAPAIAAVAVFAAAPPRQFGLGTAAVAAGLAAGAFAHFYAALAGGAVSSAATSALSPDASFLPAAAILRYRALLAGPPSELVAHTDGDPACPCPRKGCAGDVWAADSWYRALDICVQSIVTLLLLVLALWTPFVAAASAFWASPWALTFPLALLSFFPLGEGYTWLLRGFVIPTPPVLGLLSRLRQRALAIVVSKVIRELGAPTGGSHTSPNDADPSDPPACSVRSRPRRAPAPDPDPGARLLLLGESIRSAASSSFDTAWMTRTVLLAYFSGAVAAFALNGAAGCVAAWQLALVLKLLAFGLTDLLIMAGWNAQIMSVVELYSDAAAEIAGIEGAALAAGDAELLAACGVRARALAGLAELARFRVRILGFPVDYAAVRTAAVTAVTVAVGLWGVLRGAGVVFALGSVCPG